ncbi:putative RtcB protein [Brevibacillus phage SecTim467]|uniref:3'-phosphate/5'-hydroxy nucleic acid ligase n=2 Tax=Jenstvirus jenst TaxID=1982225 RepID=A0A0K2CNT0_9CAUD|nr:tRNA splicing ligase [Brevibacillus phage Jenst]ALA07283.1 putative RtcB protein [Brevibacillus phage Jenst]ALA07482.1 putative RtcB protein [Brevibacillus phage SecTim467]
MNNYQCHGNNHHTFNLQHGDLHVFANNEVLQTLEHKVFDMANNNLAIPRNIHMSYTPDAHVGVGTCIGTTAVWNMKDGFVSPSIVGSDIGCGMRVLKTTLHKDDLKDKDLKRKLIKAIEKYVPTNERTNSNYEDVCLDEVITDGLFGLPAKYKDAFGLTSTCYVENPKFDFDHKYLNDLPTAIFKRAAGQLGTLGGGNHFIEIQYIDLLNYPSQWATAEEWGLFDGQVVVMIHSGSRAWGGKIGQSLTKKFKEHMELWGVKSKDPNLVYAPISSEIGQEYINLMYSALNFAVVNRHMVGYGVAMALNETFGSKGETKVLYDLMHNYALKEFHRNQPMLVHRKGATRALPPGHFLNPKVYKGTGHPALIPGSMGTSSFIMVGKEEGAKNFYSICHGAGRLRSRRATKELVTVDEFAQTLRVGQDDEILVNHRVLDSILDECPQAYKNVDQIIDSVVGANLASVVAECKPMAAIKGV